MKTFSVVVIAVALVSYFVYPIARAKIVSRGLQAEAIPYEQHPQSPTLRILIAGDSTGVGTGALPSSESIAGRIGSDYPTADIHNISKNGLRVGGLKDILAQQPNSTYDLIVLQIGANDVTGFTPPDQFKTDLATVLSYANGHSSSTVVLMSGDVGLAPVFKWPLSRVFTKRTLLVRSLLMTEVNSYESIHYVDLFRDKEHDVLHTNVPLYYARDRFHPSGAGYGVWYQDVAPAVRDALRTRPTMV